MSLLPDSLQDLGPKVLHSAADFPTNFAGVPLSRWRQPGLVPQACHGRGNAFQQKKESPDETQSLPCGAPSWASPTAFEQPRSPRPTSGRPVPAGLPPGETPSLSLGPGVGRQNGGSSRTRPGLSSLHWPPSRCLQKAPGKERSAGRLLK